MSNKIELPTVLPSLAIAQGEIARYSRTGSLLHLAHASRALEEALGEFNVVRAQAVKAGAKLTTSSSST